MPEKSAQQLKALQVRKTRLVEELTQKRKIVSETQKECNEISDKINSIDRQMVALQQQPVISEHALLRYIERVLNIDMNSVKNRILTQQVTAAVDLIGSGKIPHPDGFSLVIKNKTVVTIEN